jgi:hypothetical protein
MQLLSRKHQLQVGHQQLSSHVVFGAAVAYSKSTHKAAQTFQTRLFLSVQLPQHLGDIQYLGLLRNTFDTRVGVAKC